ncbi:MAG: hypothetical protein LQ344_003989 [Seirophora lacunosa]|nr:MAG: hypothetical protein LQ344_003989 [Seirophora lacunosa]
MTSEAEAFLSHDFTHIVIGGVGVLEAGPAALDEPRIDVPGRLGETLFTEYDWQFETTPQPGLGGRKLPWNRGKVLGGSSAMNFMMWCRGNKGDYDAWEKLGNKGWGWDGMLPYFKKSETFQVPTQDYQKKHQVHYDQDYHGTRGPLHTIYSAEYGVSSKLWHETLNNLGVESNRSHMSGSSVGAWTALTAIDPSTQKRCYSVPAYYLPVAHRENLVVLTNATVRDIILEKSNASDEHIAKGVRFIHDLLLHTINVSGEVILSAGAVQSPQLLELSGIGHPAILSAAGIETAVANPNVGENLQEHMSTHFTSSAATDHCTQPLGSPITEARQVSTLLTITGTMMIYELDPSIITPEALRSDPLLAAAADEQYATSKSGPRTAAGYSAAYIPFSHYTSPEEMSRLASQLSSSSPSSESNWNGSISTSRTRDQILSSRFSSRSPSGQIEFLFDVSNYSPFFKSEPGKRYGTMMQMLQYPFSVGSIHIPASSSQDRRTDSDDKPVINPRYYEGPGGEVDFLTMAAAQKFGHKICDTRPLKDIIVKRVFPPLPDDKDAEEESWAEWVRDTTITDWHPVGTCAMGGDEGIVSGVVDDRLRVYGVKGLRVCDASVFPLHIAAHLQATVYAIGEKGADMIKEDWAQRTD